MVKNKLWMLLLSAQMLLHPMGIAAQSDTLNKTPLIVARQGSFAIGGTITTNEQGLKRHADHGYVFFQQPLHPHRLLMVITPLQSLAAYLNSTFGAFACSWLINGPMWSIGMAGVSPSSTCLKSAFMATLIL